MITANLKSILTASGCTLVLYESSQLANIVTDQSTQDSVVGLIQEPETLTLEVKANAISKHYPPIRIEVMKQVQKGVDVSAEDNEVIYTELIVICEAIINNIIASGNYRKVTSIQLTKIKENQYDAGLIGWSMPLDLYLIENSNNC